MAQHDYNIANDSFPTVRTDINNVLSAINSSNSGSSRPSSAVAGTIWLDTSGAATAQLLKLYDGAADILLGTVNFTANTVDFADSSVGGITFKQEGTNFTNSLLVGHATTGTLSAAEKNTGVGIIALDALTSGDKNTSIGYNAGSNISSGSQNTTIGHEAGNYISGGSNHTYVGNGAGLKSESGSDNVGVGNEALKGGSGYSTTKNVAVGAQSLIALTSGNGNLSLGFQAGNNITSGDGNVVIGNADVASATGDDQLSISDGEDGSVVWITGDSSGNVSVPANLNLSGSNKELRFYEGANYVGFEAPALSADKIWVLPAADGSADQVIKTDGSGNLGFATAGSGSWTLISTTTASNDSHVDITFSGSYSIYKITFVNMIGGTDNTNLNHQILFGGSVQTGTSYKYGNLFIDSNGGTGTHASGSAGSAKMTYAPMGSATGDNTSGTVTIYNPSNTLIKHTDWTFNGTQKVGSYMNKNVGGSSWGGATTAWSGFRVLYSSGNIASGVMKLWGQA